MIFDNIANRRYYSHKALIKAFDYIEKGDHSIGRHELGEGIFANVMEFNTISLERAQIEAHHNYIDIQYIIFGNETMGVAHSYSEIVTPYNAERDIYFVKAECQYFDLTSRDFAIFMPTDYHSPSIGSGGKVKKIVVKIPEGLLRRDEL